jgi:hypothetical protein
MVDPHAAEDERDTLSECVRIDTESDAKVAHAGAPARTLSVERTATGRSISRESPKRCERRVQLGQRVDPDDAVRPRL